MEKVRRDTRTHRLSRASDLIVIKHVLIQVEGVLGFWGFGVLGFDLPPEEKVQNSSVAK